VDREICDFRIENYVILYQNLVKSFSMEVNKIIENLNSLFREKFENFYGIILFGSIARGESKKDSDIDIILLFSSQVEEKTKYEAYELINDYMIEHDLFIDCKVYNYNEIKLQNTPFRKAVMTEGKLYAA
jgi:predicted nucleotidyltransferase